MDKKILVIPHIASDLIKVREKELALALANYFNVYYLNWNVSNDNNIVSRIMVSIKDIIRNKRVFEENKIKISEIPILHRPYWLAKIFNGNILDEFVKEIGINVIINASYYLFSIKKNERIKYIYDLVDLPQTKIDYIRKYVEEEIGKANLIFTASSGLSDFVIKKYNRDSVFIPNGTNIGKFRDINENEIEEIRTKYNLKGKYVIGYIGNFGNWSNIEFIIDVFLEVEKEINNAVLLLVGPGNILETITPDLKEKGIITTGAINPKDIYKYFKVIDVGILPSKITDFRNYSFPIKIIEYTAASKIIVSSPLEEVKTLAFPNIIFASPEKIIEWVNAMKKAKITLWKNEWNTIIEKYDWSEIVKLILRYIETNE